MRIKEIEYILTIVLEGSMTKAANSLYVAQSSLSQCVKKIEEQLDCKLFNRISNKLCLTQEGKNFVIAGQKIIKIIRDLENEISDISQMKKGNIIIGIPSYLGSYIIPAFFPIFRQHYPGITLNFVEGTTIELEEKLSSLQIDIAVIPLPTKNSSLVFQELFKCKMILIMDKNNPLTSRGYYKKGSNYQYFDITILDNEHYILGLPGQGIRHVNEIILEKANAKPKVIYTSRNLETIIHMVNTGLGITIIPERYLDISHTHNNIKRFYIEEEYDYEWTVVAAYHQDSYISNAINLLLLLLHKSFNVLECDNV